jgi:transposase
LQVAHPNAAAIDIGCAEHWVCVPAGRGKKTVQAFGCCTAELNRLADWLVECRVDTVVMEATGNYWVVLYDVLEARKLRAVVVNPRYAKNMSGKKGDIPDCQWMQKLHTYGLLANSFRPGQEVRVLRSYLRQREALVGAAAQQLQALQGRWPRVAAQAGQEAARAVQVAPQADAGAGPGAAAPPAKPFDLSAELKRILGVDLTQIDGVGPVVAQVVLSEVGTDMSPWPTEKHFASWLGLCPDHRISGGKVLGRATRPVVSRARNALRMSAYALTNSKSWLGAKYRRLKSRLGAPKAIVAMAHHQARLIYRMIKNGEQYVDKGMAAYEEKYREQRINWLRKQAKDLNMKLVADQGVAEPVSI